MTGALRKHLLLGLVLSPSFQVHAACDPASTRLLAEMLTLQRRHREAVLEYERLAASCSAPAEKSQALERAMDAALATGDYSFSLKFSRAWLTDLKPEQSCSLILGETKSLYGLHNEEGVLRQKLPESCPRDTLDELTYIKGLSHLRLHAWGEAAREFSGLRDSNAWQAKARSGELLAEKGPTLHWKSPGKAAAWSAVLPGAGYLYARRPQTAVASFFLTGLFIAGTYSAAHAGEPGLAALLGLFSAGWYFGGVRGSAEAARRTNDFEMQTMMEPADILRE